MSNSLPPNPNGGSPSRREEPGQRDRPGFSRSGFAPIPHRHADYPPSYNDTPERGRPGRGGPPFDEIDDRRPYDRRPPPPRWEDDYERNKRRRSPSPYHSSHRQRHHSPSPPRHGHYGGHGGDLVDPAELSYQLHYKQFAEWFRSSHPQTAKADEEESRAHRAAVEQGLETREKVGMTKRYDRYRREFISRQLFTLYLTHRDSTWFQERYFNGPKYVAQRRRVNRQGRVRTAEKYLDELREGKYDATSYDFSPESSRADSSRNADDPEGLDRALGDSHVDDDSLRVEAAPSKGQVFVRTVPPSTSRQALEEMFERVDGFEYLAMTEPAVKKAFHRVAWAQFKDGVDPVEVVQKLDGTRLDDFTFHLGVNATAVVGRARLTAPIANTLERLLVDEDKARSLAIRLEDELMGDDDDPKDDEEVKEGESEVKKSESTEPSITGLRERGSAIVQEKIDGLLQDAGLVGDLDESQQIQKAKISLDQWISYLRHGLSTCYYCVAPLAFHEELLRKCIAHLRPHAKASDHSHAEHQGEDRGEEEGDERRDYDDEREPRKGKYPLNKEDARWQEGLDLKLRSVLEPEVDPTEYGGRSLEEETKRLAAPYIKQEEVNKYRCKECNKLFKSPEFVIKHISLKHPSLFQDKLEDYAVFNNYVLDPQRIQPTTSVLAAIDDRLPTPPMVPSMHPAFPANGPKSMNAMQQQMMMMQAMMMAGGMSVPGMGGMSSMGGMGGMGGMGLGGMGGLGGKAQSNGNGRPVPTSFPDAVGPPPGGEDPRAARGRVSYLDLDEPGSGGDGGLPY